MVSCTMLVMVLMMVGKAFFFLLMQISNMIANTVCELKRFFKQCRRATLN